MERNEEKLIKNIFIRATHNNPLVSQRS